MDLRGVRRGQHKSHRVRSDVYHGIRGPDSLTIGSYSIGWNTEFSPADTVAILHSNPQPNEDTRLLLERLAVEFPGRQFPLMTYGPSLACHIGPNSLGVIVPDVTRVGMCGGSAAASLPA